MVVEKFLDTARWAYGSATRSFCFEGVFLKTGISSHYTSESDQFNQFFSFPKWENISWKSIDDWKWHPMLLISMRVWFLDNVTLLLNSLEAWFFLFCYMAVKLEPLVFISGSVWNLSVLGLYTGSQNIIGMTVCKNESDDLQDMIPGVTTTWCKVPVVWYGMQAEWYSRGVF